MVYLTNKQSKVDEGLANEAKIQAALQFAQKVTSKRGQVSSDEIQSN